VSLEAVMNRHATLGGDDGAWDEPDWPQRSRVYSKLIIVGAVAVLALLAILVLVGVPLVIHLLGHLKDQLGPLQDSITLPLGMSAVFI
jgi:hypothetical protein